jgi:two-component system sensor histidine kinase BaeS
VRVREVVSNLLTNALRHTPRDGTIEISAEFASGQATVSVADSGAGIPPDRVDRIFDRFYRSPDSPGSGLGLSISKSLVEAHGGTISATSRDGGGAMISFNLPLDRPSGGHQAGDRV